MMSGVDEVVESGDADEGALMEFEKNNAMLKAMDDMLEAMLKNVSVGNRIWRYSFQMTY